MHSEIEIGKKYFCLRQKSGYISIHQCKILSFVDEIDKYVVQFRDKKKELYSYNQLFELPSGLINDLMVNITKLL